MWYINIKTKTKQAVMEITPHGFSREKERR
jgi:hypothetical protein